MSRAVSSEPTRFAESPGVALVSLDSATAGGVHRSKVRVSDDDFVSEFFQRASDPLALRAGFDQDTCWRS